MSSLTRAKILAALENAPPPPKDSFAFVDGQLELAGWYDPRGPVLRFAWWSFDGYAQIVGVVK